MIIILLLHYIVIIFIRNWYKLNSITIAGTTEKLGAALNESNFLAALKGATDLAGDSNNNLALKQIIVIITALV